MVHYKLSYFNGRGRAELARLVFAIAGQEYEDIRFEQDQWPQHKPKMSFGQIPVLEVDGVQLNQSRVIAGFLAAQFGLDGTTNLERAQAAALAETAEDMASGFFDMLFSPPETHEKKFADYKNGKLTTFADLFEKNVKATISKEGFLVGRNLTYADLALIDIWDRLDIVGLATEVLKTRPTLAAHRERIRSLPKVAAYLAKRPQTKF